MATDLALALYLVTARIIVINVGSQNFDYDRLHFNILVAHFAGTAAEMYSILGCWVSILVTFGRGSERFSMVVCERLRVGRCSMQMTTCWPRAVIFRR